MYNISVENRKLERNRVGSEEKTASAAAREKKKRAREREIEEKNERKKKEKIRSARLIALEDRPTDRVVGHKLRRRPTDVRRTSRGKRSKVFERELCSNVLRAKPKRGKERTIEEQNVQMEEKRER